MLLMPRLRARILACRKFLLYLVSFISAVVATPTATPFVGALKLATSIIANFYL